jgi:hypothetical protein
MRIRVADDDRTGWGELLIDGTSMYAPVLFYKGSLWSAEAALRRGLRFDVFKPQRDGSHRPARRIWALALVRAAIFEQTHWSWPIRSAIRHLLNATH